MWINDENQLKTIIIIKKITRHCPKVIRINLVLDKF